MKYRVDPGLYAVGAPDKESPVFLSANYKKSFDILRKELAGIDCWVLALDTKGINVWCAAGKGTFGTKEIIHQIQSVKLSDIVSHRVVIAPQLGAPGIHSHKVKSETGLTVKFGPVEASDIPAYLAAGNKATPTMRTIRFSAYDRAVLTPMELVSTMKKFPWIALAIFVVFGLQPDGVFFGPALRDGGSYVFLLLASILMGTVVVPIMLPLVPFRAFALKGFIAGLVPVAIAHWLLGSEYLGGVYPLIAAYIALGGYSSYLAFNFTGCTTFTSLSGVKRELKVAIPLYFLGGGLSLVALVIYKISSWGLI